jgi:hypothetical protein
VIAREFTRAELQAELVLVEHSDPDLADAIRAALETGSRADWLEAERLLRPSS